MNDLKAFFRGSRSGLTSTFEDTRPLEAPREVIFRFALIAAEECRFKVRISNQKVGFIRLRTRTSFWSWGEYVDIKITEAGVVRIKSRCVLPTQLVSWGKNRGNVQRLFEIIEQEVALEQLSR